MAIDPGELREVVEIARVIEIADENGFDNIEKIEVKYKLRAKKKTIGTKEYMQAGRDITKLTHNFVCRNRNIDSDMIVIYKNEIFNIKHIHEFDSEFMQLTCEKVE